MARFVPARPLPDLAEDLKEPLFAAEDYLDDVHVVVQPLRGEPGVVLHPESGVFAIICIPGLRRRPDPAREIWLGPAGAQVDVARPGAAAGVVPAVRPRPRRCRRRANRAARRNRSG